VRCSTRNIVLAAGRPFPTLDHRTPFIHRWRSWLFNCFRLRWSGTRLGAQSNGYRNCEALSLIGSGNGSSVYSIGKCVSTR